MYGYLLCLTGGETAGLTIAILFIIATIVFIMSVKIVRQANAMIVERLGKYNRTLNTGFHLTIPFFERASKPISLKEKVADFKPQPVITKDNVTMQIDTVVYFQITDPKLYAYGVESPIAAIEN